MNQNKAIKMIREQLADYAHDAWSGWMKYLFNSCTKLWDGRVAIPVELVERWEMQMTTDYKDLPEDMKPSDRKEADRMLAITDLDTVTRQRDEKHDRIIALREVITKIKNYSAVGREKCGCGFCVDINRMAKTIREGEEKDE